ncbi:complex I NDUFA9 subunit family protein [Salinarimonas ramus]|uniref:Oxidoreductase n=1 Tax=Salinarimonas ramus TaxID=690164 RepID=A0A917Q8L6_9HYPH|nr:complex I NDUFA9 subunit family protein [Salinarimonas ramus]GGK35082.1 oxidoreductase [Salinarimonas ramus]
MQAAGWPSAKLITVFGGSGFLGKVVCQVLARRGYRVRVAVRRPDLAYHLQPLGTVGQIMPVQANLRYPDSVKAALKNADGAINLVGILQESGKQTFSAVQTQGAAAVARAAAEAGIPLAHVSAIGADPQSPSAYGRTKAEGEALVLEACPDAVVLRPSIVFGPGDGFFTRFAVLARALPVMPIAAADTRFQPVYVADVAEAIARAMDGTLKGGTVYELGGPEVLTFREVVEHVLRYTERRRMIVTLPGRLARMQAALTETLDKITMGLIPDEIVLTRDQLKMLEVDNVVSEAAKAQGRTLEGMGISPTSVEAIVPSYLRRFRRFGQFESKRDPRDGTAA